MAELAPSTATVAAGPVSDLQEANLMNIRYLLEDLVEDKMKPSVFRSRKVWNSELDGEYIPHYYLCKWNRHHINLLFDSIHINAMEPIDQVNDTRNRTLLETLYIQKDFANMFKCMGQDGATCEQPRTAIQEVSCFHIILLKCMMLKLFYS